ncbi:MAG: DUF4145 domain-containing protein [Planctomycetes bacterium]|nr:DUF4145 domain-containing protein [Planctomycetota bacterium]
MAKKLSASERLETLISESWAVVKKARKQRKSLAGDNFYAEKLAAQRSAATNLYKEMSVYNVGDVAALAEMIDAVFSHDTNFDDRRTASRNLLHEIRTVWKIQSVGDATNDADSIFPMTLLAKTKRGYLSTIGAQMNGAYAHGWCDACAVMMRRLLEASIIEAFEERGIAANIKNKKDEYVMLTKMIDKAMAETSWTLGRVTKKALPGLRDLGHQSAHGRRFTAQKSDIDKVRTDVRTTVEEFLHLAALL